MADLRGTQIQYILTLTPKEYSLLTKGLGIIAGYDISTRGEDREPARELNRKLLELRQRYLQNELRGVEGALAHIEAEASPERTGTFPEGTVGKVVTYETSQNPETGRAIREPGWMGGGGGTVIG